MSLPPWFIQLSGGNANRFASAETKSKQRTCLIIRGFRIGLRQGVRFMRITTLLVKLFDEGRALFGFISQCTEVCSHFSFLFSQSVLLRLDAPYLILHKSAKLQSDIDSGFADPIVFRQEFQIRFKTICREHPCLLATQVFVWAENFDL